MVVDEMYAQLRSIAHQLETRGHLYSADEQAFLRMAATAVVETVRANYTNKKYSYDEDD